ncbi:MAG: glycosyl transferase family 1 [Elusimicrobia bacterium RIFOXYA2_FULL_40_6]|nr:MAG: glycosyl transferase family 1 [Elusimicrobia bacterium RIFOXYA2_FULL_40_6]
MDFINNIPEIKKIVFIGNYLPRKCGIATFTETLYESIANQFHNINCFAIPVNDTKEGYDYPDCVRFEIREQEIDSYKRAADFININAVNIVSLQHEYGIFGGPSGVYILTLLKKLQMPVVTTLHTVLKNPNNEQRQVMEGLTELSDIFVVMTKRSADFLTDIYKVPENKVRLIPHGIPDIPFIDSNFYKDQFGLAGKFVLLTFGLLSPNKGIENVIQALPSIVKEYPNVVYVILGATHPNLVREEGEAYRLKLQNLAEELGVTKNVIFYNRFVTMEELKEFIVTADIYITPYLDEKQAVSGTLAYSFGAGNAVISTPYWHAAELLDEGRGILVPFNDPDAIAREVLGLVRDNNKRNTLRKNAFILGREMTWSNTGKLYMETFKEARLKHPTLIQKKLVLASLDQELPELPAFKLDHLYRMTDSTGIIQHATFNIPNLAEGYCTDDNARALILTIFLDELKEGDKTKLTDMATIYLAFLNSAFNDKTHRFRNFMNYNRTWVDEANGVGSEDSHGRAIWALGTCIGRTTNAGFRNFANMLFEKSLQPICDFSSPRAWAFCIIGLHEYLRCFDGDRRVHQIRQTLAKKLFELYKVHSSEDWPWFESVVTYCNARLSHALILSGRWLENKEMLDSGLKSLEWLIKIQTSPKNRFRPVGSSGFYKQGEEISIADQQPVEALTMISACIEAFNTTGELMWYTEARKAFQWFMGRNDLDIPLYDSLTGGCRDALHVDRVNQNEGAESSLSFYSSLAELTTIQNMLRSRKS